MSFLGPRGIWHEKSVVDRLNFSRHDRFLSLVFLLTRKTVSFYIAPSAIESTAMFVSAHEPLAFPKISILRDLALASGTDPPNAAKLGRITVHTSPPAMLPFFVRQT